MDLRTLKIDQNFCMGDALVKKRTLKATVVASGVWQ